MGSTAVPQVRFAVGTDAVLLGKCVACTSQTNAVPWDTPLVAPTVVHLVRHVVGTIAVHLVTCVVESHKTDAAHQET